MILDLWEWLNENFKMIAGIVGLIGTFVINYYLPKEFIDAHKTKLAVAVTVTLLGLGYGLFDNYREQKHDAILKMQKAKEGKFWFEFKKNHKGIAKEPVKPGQQLIVEWWIPNRPICQLETHIPVITDEDGKWIAQGASYTVLPRSAHNPFGRPLNRYRLSNEDFSISHFDGTGVIIPRLKPGKYALVWQYVFEQCIDSHVPLVVITGPVEFEVVKE